MKAKSASIRPVRTVKAVNTTIPNGKTSHADIKGAFTIVSNNYVPAARTLASSFKKHHPNVKFYVVLVDEAIENILTSSESFELVHVSEINIPDFGSFVYKYTVMELNTAVKPFALAYIFDKTEISKLIYIDPDIEIFRNIESVWDGLDEADIVLTPHMRAPFNDTAAPSELAILQAGTYNLGFIGLRRSKAASELIAWWQEKLFNDCVVDIPVGLFVDQKWMDLVPGYFPSAKILSDPSLNVAYWNLHDRQITLKNETYVVDDDIPLSFFHYSGYSPLRPELLSKHQNRHDLKNLDHVRDICLSYGKKLLDNGYLENQHAPYAFDTLPNGVKMTRSMRIAVRMMIAQGETCPNPLTEPLKFCQTLATPRTVPGQGFITPVEQGIFSIRLDVAKAYGAGSAYCYHQSGIEGWLSASGRIEENLGSFLDAVGPFWIVKPDLTALLNILIHRPDVYENAGAVFESAGAMDALVRWVKTFGKSENLFSDEAVGRLILAQKGPRIILNLYFLRTDLQAAFADLSDFATLEAFVTWLRQNTADLQLSDDQIEVFRGVAIAQSEWWKDVSFVATQPQQNRLNGVPTVFAIADPNHPAHFAPNRARMLRAMVNSESNLVKQAQIYLTNRRREGKPTLTAANAAITPLIFPLKEGLAMLEARGALFEAINGINIPKLNIGGMFLAPSGMGEAARSVSAIATAAGHEIGHAIVPTLVDQDDLRPSPYIYGLPYADAQATITIVNADMVDAARKLLPAHYWSAYNIGYWLWETDRLPPKFKDSTRFYDEIWTSSHTAADAIALTVDLPVKVLPLSIDLDSINSATSRRSEFGLNENATIFAYFFDLNSILQRKNPEAVVTAFKSAFGNDPSFQLLLKVNGNSRASFETARLRSLLNQDNIILMESTLSRQQTFDLLASIDVYCSLHRYEGFGLSCAEAMALGKPVIATGYSGNMEFMDSNSASLISFELFKTSRPYGPYPAGTLWAEPNQEEVVERMRLLADQAVQRQLGKAGRKAVLERLAPGMLAKKFAAMLPSRL